ncbi:MAG: adventurous gliding motility protein CglF [Myxococcaceae bacterium]
MKWLFAAFCVGFSVPAVAQQAPESAGGARYNKTTVIDFEGDTIEGDLTRPDGEYVEARKRVRHSNLIRIREEFKDKVMQSVGEL